MNPTATVTLIKDTYLEVEDIEESKIQLQLKYASLMVDKDIKNRELDEDYREMAEVYMTCHLLYINYFKTSEDKLDSTTDKKLTPKLGMGLQGSPYGQMYLSIKNQASGVEEAVSGIGIL
ncbi:hypothetical protein [Fusobacterium ulcerans]|jgi:hypothetical protein|uniref:hypothetical protein n=1 Tax=Fusobacterium ulcerans TaxID=861 RepID=UPI0027BABCC0|nr:hypothetical protein [Fusobacterium ulcerans]